MRAVSVDEEDDEVDAMPLLEEYVPTSRDWVFIKECIGGGQLPPKGVSINKCKESNDYRSPSNALRARASENSD